MLSLYLLRHAETELSRQDRFCGRIDAPLTDAGHDAAVRFAAAYGALPWRAIVTSTRRRTVETAAPLAAHTGVEPIADGRLDEIDYGRWQGLSKDEAATLTAQHYLRWSRDPTVGPPGGEPPSAVVDRALAVVRDVSASYETGNVLLVSHKTVLRLLLCRMLGIELRRYRDRLPWPAGALHVVQLEAQRAGRAGEGAGSGLTSGDPEAALAGVRAVI